MLWGPVFLMGGLFNLAGHLLLAFSWLCLMEPRMAAREWNTLTEKIKRLWKKE